MRMRMNEIPMEKAVSAGMRFSNLAAGGFYGYECSREKRQSGEDEVQQSEYTYIYIHMILLFPICFKATFC